MTLLFKPTNLSLLVACLLALTSPAWAATRYLSPTGSDGAAGTSGAPWKTFNFARGQLVAGDTLLLKDGTYTESTSGHIDFTCPTNAPVGTAGARVTIKAENERQAFIQSNGAVNGPVRMSGCSYWTIEGLRVESGDFSSQTSGVEPGTPMVVQGNATNVILRRNLIRFDNRYQNTGAILTRIQNSLFEENEIYSFHRHGFMSPTNINNTYRRNYANSRGHADISGGFVSANADYNRGDSAFITYPSGTSDNNIYENNISEGNGEGFQANSFYTDKTNMKLYGNISLNDTRGVLIISGDSAHGLPMTSGFAMTDMAVVGAAYGLQLASARSSCTNCTIHATSQWGLLVYKIAASPGDGVYSFVGTNMLVYDAVNTGIQVTADIQTWSFDHVNSFSNGTNYSPTTSGNYGTNRFIQDPQLGTCKVWIPDSSPMKTAGTGGGPLGAHILYRYQDGVLTSTPLWDPSTGAFPCGATVAGVNDTAGNSCVNVHTRLNINTGGCPFPAGYAVGGGGGTAPKHRVVISQ